MTVTYPAHPGDMGLLHNTWLREEAGEQYSFKWIDDGPLSTRILRKPYVVPASAVVEILLDEASLEDVVSMEGLGGFSVIPS